MDIGMFASIVVFIGVTALLAVAAWPSPVSLPWVSWPAGRPVRGLKDGSSRPR